MKIFSDLKEIIGLERHHAPYIETLADRDIVVNVGYHDVIIGDALTLKLLFLLDIGSVATVQRRLSRLVELGVVVKRPHREDRRANTLHLSVDTRREYLRYQKALVGKNGNGRAR